MADQINNELVSGGEYSLFRDDILKRIRSAQYEALRVAFFLGALSLGSSQQSCKPNAESSLLELRGAAD